jgi:hypothetical protein
MDSVFDNREDAENELRRLLCEGCARFCPFIKDTCKTACVFWQKPALLVEKGQSKETFSILCGYCDLASALTSRQKGGGQQWAF